MVCTVNVQEDLLLQVNCSTWHAAKCQKRMMNAEISYSTRHCHKCSENTDDCKGWITAWKVRPGCNVYYSIHWRSPESLQCHGFIMRGPMAVPGWHFAAVLWTKYIFLKKKIACEKLKIKSYIRWHRNKNYSVWMSVLYLWK